VRSGALVTQGPLPRPGPPETGGARLSAPSEEVARPRRRGRAAAPGEGGWLTRSSRIVTVWWRYV